MTRPLYAPEPQGVRSASSSAFEFWENYYKNAELIDERTAFDRKRDRIVEQRANRYITEREKIEALREVDDAERAAERHSVRKAERERTRERRGQR